MEAVSAAAVGVEDLDDAALLGAASEAERWDRRVQRRKLEIAYEWCVRHPVAADGDAATWGDSALPGLRDCDASLGGDGSPAVAAFAAEELGAAMGISTQSAMGLMADALDLRHRLPLLWAKVETGDVAPWRTRRVADDTRSLSFEAARWVDAQLAARADGFGLPTIERLVALAAARFAPEEQAQQEEAQRAQHYVRLTHGRVTSPAPPIWRRPVTARTWPRSTHWSVPKRNSWGGWVTPTTTRPARPRPSVSSPPAREPWSSPTRPRTGDR